VDPAEIDVLGRDDIESGLLDTTTSLSQKKRWYELWRKLFPVHAHDQPSSPYDEPSLTYQESLTKTMEEEVPGLMEQYTVPLNNRNAFLSDLLALVDRSSNPTRRFRHLPSSPPRPPPQAQQAMEESPSTAFGPAFHDHVIGQYIGVEDLAGAVDNSIETAGPQWNPNCGDPSGMFGDAFGG
jgi:hypothetical protein